jgi:hypothetical protein
MKSQDIVILLKLVSLQDQAEPGDHDLPGHDLPGHDLPGHDLRGHGRSGGEDPYSVRGLAASLGISKSEVNASLHRSLASGLAARGEGSSVKPNRRNLHNFIVHGLKFVFPVKPGGMTRGVPTAFAAPVLEGLMSAGEYIYVWPYAEGKDMGQSVEPLFKSVPAAVRGDRLLYEYLALVDAIRLGKQRESGLAAERLGERLLKK